MTVIRVRQFCFFSLTNFLHPLTKIVFSNVSNVNFASHSGAFLVQLSSLVRSIHLHQQPVYRARRSNYLFGVTNGDWGRIVFDMYAKNIDTLCIDNAMFPEYLSKDAADSLMKVRVSHIHKFNFLNFFLGIAFDRKEDLVQGYLQQVRWAFLLPYRWSLRARYASRTSRSLCKKALQNKYSVESSQTDGSSLMIRHLSREHELFH